MTGSDETFDDLRPRLFGLAYRMLGTVADAEDIVHDAYLRWRSSGRDDIRSPGAYLTTVVTRLCVDALGSARARRERYVGPWLPEPVLVAAGDPAESAELADSLSLAFLVLLEELTPPERAAFLLHDVFDYGYDELSAMLAKEEPACRQLVSRARRHVAARGRRFDADRHRAEKLSRQFVAACAGGDVEGLVAILADDAVVWTDGGGKATAARRPVVGAERAARFLVGVVRKIPPGSRVQLVALNGQPGVVVIEEGAVTSAVALDIIDGAICGVRVIVNPDKLSAVNAALAPS